LEAENIILLAPTYIALPDVLQNVPPNKETKKWNGSGRLLIGICWLAVWHGLLRFRLLDANHIPSRCHLDRHAGAAPTDGKATTADLQGLGSTFGVGESVLSIGPRILVSVRGLGETRWCVGYV